MLTCPKSTMRVRPMPMHLSSGHVTGAEEILPPPLISFQSDLGRRADSRWALPQISSLICLDLPVPIALRSKTQFYKKIAKDMIENVSL